MRPIDDPRPAVAPLLFWRVLAAANLLSLSVLLLAFHFMFGVAVLPSLASWFLLAGAAMTLPAGWYLSHGRRLDRQPPPGLSRNALQLAQLKRLVLGCALAELPGLMGTLYYLFGREWLGTVALLAATLVLLWFARPLE